MLVAIITSALIDQLITALSSTLVYSLLQGVALAAAGGIIILATGKASPATRYNLLIGALVVFAIGSVFTFGVQFSRVYQSATITTATAGNLNGNFDIALNNATPAAVALQPTDYLAALSAFVSEHHNTIVLVWFLVICIKAIQMGVGLQNVYRLKRSGVIPASTIWPELMRQMAQRLGINQQINLLESALAKVPMVIGHFKPVILMPIGLLSALGTAEIEAILMHELAHIRRRDYLVNLLQSIVEVVFFFNPAVLWVSQLIKTERENCCDDIALAQTNSKHSYIQALVSCEEYQQGNATYTVAFSGTKNSLISRVKRMVSNRNHGLNTFEKTLLTVWLVISGLCLSAFAEKETIKKTIHQVVKAISPKEEKNPVAPIAKIAPITTETIKQTPAPVAAMVETPEEEVPQIESAPAVHPVSLPVVTPVAPRDTGRLFRSTRSLTSLSHTTSAILNLKEISRVDSVDQVDVRRAPAIKPSQSSLLIREEMIKDGLIEKGKFLPYSISDRAFTINGVKQPEELVRKYWLLNIGDPVQYARRQEANKRESRMVMNAVLLQMSKDKLIVDGDDNLSFSLNEDEFIVNGQKQPDAIFQKYVNQFVKSATGGGKLKLSYVTQK